MRLDCIAVYDAEDDCARFAVRKASQRLVRLESSDVETYVFMWSIKRAGSFKTRSRKRFDSTSSIGENLLTISLVPIC